MSLQNNELENLTLDQVISLLKQVTDILAVKIPNPNFILADVYNSLKGELGHLTVIGRALTEEEKQRLEALEKAVPLLKQVADILSVKIPNPNKI